MITIVDYQAHRARVCIDCVETKGFAAERDSEGELFDPHFSRALCDFCGSSVPGDRFRGTYLTSTTTIRGEDS